MSLRTFMGLLKNSDLLRIIRKETGEQLYIGFLGVLRLHKGIEETDLDCVVKQFRAVPEIRHKEWQEKRLLPPLLPEQTPMYSFSDLQMELFYEIYI